MAISPLELEETVRRQLEKLLLEGHSGLAALARLGWDAVRFQKRSNQWKIQAAHHCRLERLSLGAGASMEDLLPGEGALG